MAAERQGEARKTERLSVHNDIKVWTESLTWETIPIGDYDIEAVTNRKQAHSQLGRHIHADKIVRGTRIH
jgi:hypothetical protein